MDESIGTRIPQQRVSRENGLMNTAAYIEHPSERKARLEEQGENGKLRRWKEKTFIKAFLALAFLMCAVWAFVVLSGRFSQVEQQQVTEVLKGVLYVVGGFVASKGVDKWIDS